MRGGTASDQIVDLNERLLSWKEECSYQRVRAERLRNENERLRDLLKEIVDAYGMGSTPEAFCRHIEEPILAARKLLTE